MSVAIVGLYPVTAGVVGPAAMRDAVCDGDKHTPVSSGIDIDLAMYTETKHAYLDPATELALASVSGAMSDAGWKRNGESIGLCIGSALGCSVSAASHVKTLSVKGGRFSSPFIFSHAYPNSSNAVVSLDLGLKGFNTCVVCGVVSGGIAVGAAYDQIALGRHEKILAGGTDCVGKNIQGDESTVSGACFLALQDAASAKREQRRVYGLLRSWRCGVGDAAALAEEAAGDAGLKLKDVGMIMGNVKIGSEDRFADFGSFPGCDTGAAAVLDAARFCVLFATRPQTALVVRKDPLSGVTCVLVLSLP